MVESKFKGIKWALAKIELLETKNQELKAESALILATKAKQNTFWACKDHKLQSTLRCAICDEERIAELEAQLIQTSTHAYSLKWQYRSRLRKLQAQLAEYEAAWQEGIRYEQYKTMEKGDE